MGTHGAASTRQRALPPGNRTGESARVTSAARRPLLNLSNWPVSRRLFAVIVAALLMGVIFGGLRVTDAEASAAQLSRTAQLANLGDQLVTLVDDLQNERDASLAVLVTDTTPPPQLQALFGKTDAAVAAVQQSGASIGSGFPANIQADVTTVLDDITAARINGVNGVGGLHNTINPNLPTNELTAIADYGAVISDMINLSDQMAQGVSDAPLTSDVQALHELSLAKEQVSQQRALLNFAFDSRTAATNNGGAIYGLANGTPTSVVVVDPDTEQALSAADTQALVDQSGFQQSATSAEENFFTNALGVGKNAATLIGETQDIEQNIFNNANTLAAVQPATPAQPASGGNPATPAVPAFPIPVAGSPLLESVQGIGTINTIDQAQTAWAAGMGDQLGAMQATEGLIAANIIARVGQLHSSAEQSALAFGVITVLVLAIVLFAALAVARSLVLPLRRLRADALNIASVQLPERVRLLSESPETAGALEVAPINVMSEDEIGQVARAFDQVHSEAVRLAGEQALLRSSFNAMFVNLSRRSQSLIERLARTIDTMEQSEDDPDRLGSLFSMDHMVTRMRRNSENLLLLAGHENPRKWSDSIPLADVARAATSEIEQYNRVTLNVPPGISVIGQAVSDVVHLIAELVENATIFSPKDTQVQLSMQELTSGGVLIEILDKGIGVSEARLADMNFRLDNPPTIDVSVSRHMGLFAVARLAERHRVRVRLRPANPQGLSALVWLPDSVIERTARYGSVQSWSTQSAPAQTMVGARQQAGQDLALEDGGATLTQNGYGGNGAGGNGYGGNGAGGNGYGANSGAGLATSGTGPATSGAGPASSGSGLPGREGRTASGWFRGQVAGAPGDGRAPMSGGAPNGGGTPQGGLGAPPDWSVRRVPGESLGGSSFAEQTSAGLPVRSPRTSQTPGGTGGQTPGGTGGQPLGGTGDQLPGGTGGQNPPGSGSLPTRGASDPSRPAPSRGPVPRGPGGGNHALPQRSPDQARSRLSAFQRGTRRAEEKPGQSGQFGQASGAGEGSDR